MQFLGPIADNFTWNTQATKLLLALYRERKVAFRDPKIKKKKLWQEICEQFVRKGYATITEDCLDRKMRNLKKTYRTIKDNNKRTTTGRGRISWEYYDAFEELFQEDRTMNIGPTLSSLQESQDQESQNQEPQMDEDNSILPQNSERTHKLSLDIPFSMISRSPSPLSSTSETASSIHSHFSPTLTADDDSALELHDETSIDGPSSSHSHDSPHT